MVGYRKILRISYTVLRKKNSWMLESIGNEPGPFHCIQRRKLTHIGGVLRSEGDTRNNR